MLFQTIYPETKVSWTFELVKNIKIGDLISQIMLLIYLQLRFNYANFTLTAFKPLSLFCTSKTTLSFSRIILVFNPEECTNMSLLPSAGVIKPKPLASLKNFTVPSCIVIVLKLCIMICKRYRLYL